MRNKQTIKRGTGPLPPPPTSAGGVTWRPAHWAAAALTWKQPPGQVCAALGAGPGGAGPGRAGGGGRKGENEGRRLSPSRRPKGGPGGAQARAAAARTQPHFFTYFGAIPAILP